MSNYLTPVTVAERLIGDIELISDILGLSDKAAYSYRNPTSQRDAGDFPSSRHLRKLLKYSDDNKLGLTAEHLICGASEADVNAILAARNSLPVKRAPVTAGVA